MRPSYLIISSLPLLALALPQPADDPNPQDIRFFGASYNGNGCPDGTAGYFFGLDGKKWTASYDSFVAHLEPNATATEKITCDTIFKFTIPKGWQFTLETVNSRYTANIGLDVRGWIEAAFTFSGKSRDANPSRYLSFKGPIKGEGVGSFNYFKEALYSPCGGQVSLTLQNQFRLWYPDGFAARHNATVLSTAALDSQEGALAWRRC